MNVLTVTQVNTYIKALLDEIPQIKNVYIEGEISNFKHYYNSGHMYFTLKDSKAQLKCVMFSSDNYKLKFKPEDGMKVICFGQIGVYERDGVYQLYVRDMQPQGIGSLTIAFEQLKEKLEKEGLFSEHLKKPIPDYPQKIGVATSKMGAAVEDIKNVISRRYPLCDIIIVPTVVQGDAAASDIAESIVFLDKMEDIDLIIVGRGGGSIEDLWAFNTETVARAVYNCKTPIISAVGHETDYTICDFVADLRAPTPSAAAELSVPDINSEKIKIASLGTELEKSLTYRIETEEQKLKNITENSVLANKNEMLDSLLDKINACYEKISKSTQYIIDSKDNSFKGIVSTLNALSPLNILSRGYSIVSTENGVTATVDELKADDKIDITFADGKAYATITEVRKND